MKMRMIVAAVALVIAGISVGCAGTRGAQRADWFEGKEFVLANFDEWTDVLKIETPSFIKLDGYTTENNYFQPWEIYCWRAYSFQPADLKIVPLPTLHEHSRAVEWRITDDGVLQIKKTRFARTNRSVSIRKVYVYRGGFQFLMKPEQVGTHVPKSLQ